MAPSHSNSTVWRQRIAEKILINEAGATTKQPSTTFAAFAVRYYVRFWAIGLLWNLARWMSIFLCSYLVNQLTHSPFLVQIVGAFFFAPMFLAGAISGVVSDRLDRRRMLLTATLGLLIPAATVMSIVTASGNVEVWMVYPFILAIGVSNVIDMTSRRAMVYDLVGTERITNALAWESLAMTSGTLLGGILGGTIISLFGIDQAFVLVMVFYIVSLIILIGVPATTFQVVRTAVASVKPNILQDLKSAFGYLKGNYTLISILGVTAIMNMFYFPFTPLVPTFAEQLNVSAFWTGVLAGSPPVGSIVATMLIARGFKISRGHAYVFGTMFAMVFLGVFAASNWYLVSVIALMVAGLGSAGFATMQSVLVMTTASDEMRGRALGLLSMSIGTLPFAMIILGGLAQAVGPSAGLVTYTIIGLVVMTAWTRLRPEAHRLP